LFDNGVRGHIFVSWLHPYKEQRLIVVGSKKMAAFDDVSKELRLFDQRVEWQNGHPLPVRNGSKLVEYASDEPLRLECQALLASIASRILPLTDGQSALDVLEVLTAAQRSLMTQGQPIHLPMRRLGMSVADSESQEVAVANR
jgi:predicted dehydrogenase